MDTSTHLPNGVDPTPAAAPPTVGSPIDEGPTASTPGTDDSGAVADIAASDYHRFGEDFVRLVLHKRRVTESIDRVLGDNFSLGPIGAGPGRKVAKATASGRFQPSFGHPLTDGRNGFRLFVPLAVIFDLDLRVDSMRFEADVVVPLTIVTRLEEPVTIVWDIIPPTEDEVRLEVRTSTLRSTLLQKVAGIDGELRRFILRFVARELEKPHVQKARRIPLVPLIDAAWPLIAREFLPNSPDDRSG